MKKSQLFPKVIFLFFFIILGYVSEGKNEILKFQELPDTAITLHAHLKIYCDQTREMEWQSVYALHDTKAFSSFDDYQFNDVFERGKVDYWFYLSIEVKQNQNAVLRGMGKKPLILYQIVDNKIITDGDPKDIQYNSKGRTKYAYFSTDFPVRLNKGKNEFLIHRQPRPTYYPIETQPTILKESSVPPVKEKLLYLYFASNGLFLGMVLFICFFSLIQYLRQGHKPFFYYSLYTLCLFLVFFRNFGNNNPYYKFLPDAFYGYEFQIIFNLLVIVTNILFVRVFLNFKEIAPKIDKFCRYYLYAIAFYFLIDRAAIYFIDLSFAFRMNKYVRPILLCALIGLIFSLFPLKDKKVRFIIIGSFLAIVSTLIGLILTFGDSLYWVWWHKANALSQVGILLELFLFSFGLGHLLKEKEIERNLAKINLEVKERETLQLKELDQLKDRFYTNITHELRTPLTVINGLTNQISNRPNFKLTERLGLIKNNTKNLIELINQLLDLSKLEAGHVDLNYQQQDIIPYLKFLTESFQSVAFDKKIMLSFYAKDTALWMDFDTEKIKRIIVNLLANALKFTPEYGKIMVVADTMTPALVTEFLSKEAKGNLLIVNNLREEEVAYLAISIKDSGRGIATENLPYIFDRFYQTTAESQLQKGTGLGLALVKELMILMGGAIQVKSVLEEGATITLLLPICQNTEKKSNDFSKNKLVPKLGTSKLTITPKLPIKSSPQPKILIVEDSKDVIYYLKACLEEKFELTTARNGQEGIEKAQQVLPHLIISDVMMPKMDGFEMCQIIKKDPKTAHVPVILLTARTQKSDIHKGLIYGADAYLTKPFDEVELLLRIDNLLSIREKVKAQILEVQPAKTMSDEDAQFLDKLQNIILENLANEDFNTTHLCRAMTTSRSQLHRKLKSLTDFPTADYIRHIRLQKAQILLTTTELSIREISMQVGFKTQAHFSRTYLKAFNETPSETRK